MGKSAERNGYDANNVETSDATTPGRRPARLSKRDKRDRMLHKKGKKRETTTATSAETPVVRAVDVPISTGSEVDQEESFSDNKRQKRKRIEVSPTDAAVPVSAAAVVAAGQPPDKQQLTKAQKKNAAKKRKKEDLAVAKQEAADSQPKKKAKKSKAQPEAFSEEVKWYMADLEDTSSRGSLSDRLNPSHTCLDKELKQLWGTFSKKERAAITASDVKRKAQKDSEEVHVDHPFDTNADDHCETSADAYWHIKPLLNHLAKLAGKDAASLQIYDPYYCAGAVKEHLQKLGFQDIYNECEDFYAVIEEGRIPPHDVVVTNPPYSGDHVERLLKWCRSNGKPFFILMPNHFCQKPYYQAALGGAEAATSVLYLYPFKRYSYWTPKGLRSKDKVQKQHSGSGGNRTSPFISFWFLDLAPLISEKMLRRWWAKEIHCKPNFGRDVKLSSLKDLPSNVLH